MESVQLTLALTLTPAQTLALTSVLGMESVQRFRAQTQPQREPQPWP